MRLNTLFNIHKRITVQNWRINYIAYILTVHKSPIRYKWIHTPTHLYIINSVEFRVGYISSPLLASTLIVCFFCLPHSSSYRLFPHILYSLNLFPTFFSVHSLPTFHSQTSKHVTAFNTFIFLSPVISLSYLWDLYSRHDYNLLPNCLFDFHIFRFLFIYINVKVLKYLHLCSIIVCSCLLYTSRCV